MPSLEGDLEQEMLAALEADSSEEEDASPPSPTDGAGGLLGKRDLPDDTDHLIESSKRPCYDSSNLVGQIAFLPALSPDAASLPLPPPPAAGPNLMSLSAPCILGIMSRLSPEDLCHLAQTNRYFRVAASDPGIWRALFNHRWSNDGPSRDIDLTDGTFNATSGWKEMYLQRDSAEVAAETRRAPEDARDMFLAMATARRSEALSPRVAAEINPLLGTALDERVAAFRRIRGLSGNNTVNINSNSRNTHSDLHPSDSSMPSSSLPNDDAAQLATMPPASSLPTTTNNSTAATAAVSCSEGCSFVELEANYWICEKGGHIHICGHSCNELKIDNVSEMLVCSLTGRCFPRLMSEWEETGGRGALGNGGDEEGDGNGGGRDGEDLGGGDWNAQEGMGGRLGRAFFAGYNAADEREMLMKFGIRM